MSQYQVSDWSTSEKEILRGTREGYISVIRVCDFCEHPYQTPDIRIKVSAFGQNDVMSRWFKNDIKSKTDEKYSIKECQTTTWLMQGKGSTTIGAFCPKCHEFSAAFQEKNFKDGEDQFLREIFLKYVYFGMWWKVIFFVIFIFFLILSFPAEAIGGTCLTFFVIAVLLQWKFRLFSRFDHVPLFIKNLQVIQFQAHLPKDVAALMLKDIYVDSGMRKFRPSKVFDTVMGAFLHVKQLEQEQSKI